MLKIIRGDTININVEFTDVNDSAIDIAGATVYFTMKQSLDDSDAQAIIKKVVTTHSDPTHGKTTISLTATETATFVPGQYYYDISIKYANGNIQSVPKDEVFVEADVTLDTT